MIVHAEHDEHIRGHPYSVVVHPVIHQHIAGHIDVAPVAVALPQDMDGFGKRFELQVGFGQGFTIRRGVVDVRVVLRERAVEAASDECGNFLGPPPLVVNLFCRGCHFLCSNDLVTGRGDGPSAA